MLVQGLLGSGSQRRGPVLETETQLRPVDSAPLGNICLGRVSSQPRKDAPFCPMEIHWASEERFLEVSSWQKVVGVSALNPLNFWSPYAL